MKRKLLWTMAFAGVLVLVVGVVLHSLIFSALAALSARMSVAIAAIHRWIHSATMHMTTTQIVEGAGIAWFFFVLALVLLARSGRAEARTRESPVESPDEAAIADSTPAPREPVPEAIADSLLPLLPLSHAEREVPAEHAQPTRNDPDEHLPSGQPTVPTVPAVSDAVTKRRTEPEQMSFYASEGQDHRPMQKNRGHVLALTGISQTDGRLVPYGLFLVAEDVGTPPGNGTASRRGIEVITEEIVPSLASSSALKSAQLATLLKMAIMRADLDLREQGSRTAAVLETAVTGVMVVGDVVYVVNIGDCRTYLFRPSSGLLQITTAHSVISCLVDSGLLQPDAVYQNPQRDHVYRCLGGGHAATVIDVFELQVHPDDLVLLCSPGLWHALRRPQIEAVLHAAPHPRSAAMQLFQEGARCTGDDSFNACNGLVVRPLGEWVPTFGIPARPSSSSITTTTTS